MDVRLRFVKGPFAGETIPMPQGKLLIGRAKDCQLRLDSNSVSAHHCVLLLDEYALRIRDLGSKIGTVVNGIRIGTHESILSHDDRVSIDQLTFEIDLGKSADGMIVADTEPFSQNALDDTGIIEGDTGQSVPTDTVPIDTVPTDTVPTDTVPTDTARHDSPYVPSQDDPSVRETVPAAARTGVLLDSAALSGSERRGATSRLPAPALRLGKASAKLSRDRPPPWRINSNNRQPSQRKLSRRSRTPQAKPGGVRRNRAGRVSGAKRSSPD
jgi:hypothetical protein